MKEPGLCLCAVFNADFASMNSKVGEENEEYDPDVDAAYPIAAKQAMERNVRCTLAYL